MRPPDCSSIALAHGSMASLGMAACAGSIWCRRSVTSCATAEPANTMAARAPPSIILTFFMSSLSLGGATRAVIELV